MHAEEKRASTTRVLVVCKGNICRSPIAEHLLRRLVTQLGHARFEVRSAATEAFNVGKTASEFAIGAAREIGLDLSTHRARQVDASDLQWADVVLAMDKENLARLRDRFGVQLVEEARLLGDYAGVPELEVADPYRQPYAAFTRCTAELATLCERAAVRLCGRTTTPDETRRDP